MDFNAATLAMVNPTTKLVLELLASRKRARLGDIFEFIKNRGSPSYEEAVTSSLNELKALQFINETGAPLPIWNTYYVTADGLEAQRKLLSR